MESEFIQWLRGRIPADPRLRVGPGDDAAVLRSGEAAEARGELVVTSDLLADGAHFRLADEDPRRIGRKALAVNLSDLAAMAARPRAGFFSVALPRDTAADLARDLCEGFLPLAEKHNLAIGGGDTNTWDGPLVISVTLLGETTAAGPLLRGGAKPGDLLVVTGEFGGSILGRHFDFDPRVEEALALARDYTLHAGIDCSDGLSLDASRIAKESGCGVAFDLSAIPLSDAARQLSEQSDDGVSALDHALCDGEDFELILAAPPEDGQRMLNDQPLDVRITQIGEFVDEPGLWKFERGQRRPLAPRGYEHQQNR